MKNNESNDFEGILLAVKWMFMTFGVFVLVAAIGVGVYFLVKWIVDAVILLVNWFMQKVFPFVAVVLLIALIAWIVEQNKKITVRTSDGNSYTAVKSKWTKRDDGTLLLDTSDKTIEINPNQITSKEEDK